MKVYDLRILISNDDKCLIDATGTVENGVIHYESKSGSEAHCFNTDRFSSYELFYALSLPILRENEDHEGVVFSVTPQGKVKKQ
tara:strand:- start:230 stop:481 length:252 start_codon:yes stop_codon:yes gene_type:complete